MTVIEPGFNKQKTNKIFVGVILAGVVLFSCLFTALWVGDVRNQDRLPADTGPVLQAIKQLGQLHTVSYNFKDTVRQQTHEDPKGFWADIPGAKSVVAWATANHALVIAEGNVQAGVDLSKVTTADVKYQPLADGKRGLIVQLPPITIYPPNVHVRVVNESDSIFYHDKNIIPRTEAHAAQIFQQSAIDKGIVATAQQNTLHQLKTLMTKLKVNNVTFVF